MLRLTTLQMIPWASLLMALMLLAGCGTTPSGVASVPEQENNDAEAADRFAPEDYVIGVDDQLEIAVWRNEDLSVTLPVRPDGNISVPLLGDVQAGGETPVELAGEIETALATYIRDPNVTVLVREMRSQDYLYRVRVTGAVAEPVSAMHRPGMTLLDLVLDAGGLTEFAAPNRAKLYRREGGETRVYDVRLNDILQDGDLSTNHTLRPGDMVSIPERLF